MTKRQGSLRRVQSCLVCLVMAAPLALPSTLMAAESDDVSQKPTPAATGNPAHDKSSTDVHDIPTDMAPIMTLLMSHDKIRFTIEKIPGGARTITTSKDPDIAKAIRLHAQEMRARVVLGNNIRPKDPIFIETFKHHKEIKDVITDLPDGVSEDETSANPQVVLLIRAHALAVAGFVRDGMPAAKRTTPLPKGYRADP